MPTTPLKKAIKALRIYDECMNELSFAIGHFGPKRMGEGAHARLVEVFKEAMKAQAILHELAPNDAEAEYYKGKQK